MRSMLFFYITTAIAVFVDASMAGPIGLLLPEAAQLRVLFYGAFALGGVALGFAYSFKYSDTSNLYETKNIVSHPSSGFNLVDLKNQLKNYLSHLWITRYIGDIYESPVKSELTLGKFFFGKTLITTIIAFYDKSLGVLLAIILFSTVFDSLTGFYQQTLMNYFHRTFFNNRILIFGQNLIKRFSIDIFRAEVITLLFLGFETLTFANQWHIVLNRLVSASYYFNAVLVDRLVALQAMSRDFRAKLIIWASTIGGLLCILHLGKTKMPSWIPVTSIPSWMPGPLGFLMIFNISLFVLLGARYLYVTQIHPVKARTGRLA